MTRRARGRAERIATAICIAVMGVAVVSVLLNPVRNIHTAAWAAWILPFVAGLAMAIIGSFRFFVAQEVANPEELRSNSLAPSYGRGILAVLLFGAGSAFASHEALQVVGASLEGQEQLVQAQVIDIRTPVSPKNRCREFASLEFEAGDIHEICVVGKWRGSVLSTSLSRSDTVNVLIRRNAVGDWVLAVSTAPVSRSPNNALEQTRGQ